jgi:hypothetical protein
MQLKRATGSGTLTISPGWFDDNIQITPRGLEVARGGIQSGAQQTK